MLLSEVIETYIRRHPGLTEDDAFAGFLSEERIASWVGSDATRKERLRAEFRRVWSSETAAPPPMAPPPSNARSGPSGPVMHAPPLMRVAMRETTPVPAMAATVAPTIPAAATARKLSVLCSDCHRVNVWMTGGDIACRSCGRGYDDMLALIRVTPVGPFEFLFGGGWVGYATASGIALGLAGIYLLLRGL